MTPSQTSAAETETQSAPPPQRLDVVVCGSFRRDSEGLRADVEALTRAPARVLSPSGVDFVAESDGFVLLADELTTPLVEIESRHLKALRAADLVWLHAPDGYVGPSGAFELGVAHMAGVPVFCREAPADITLRNFVEVVGSPFEGVAAVQERAPGHAGAPLAALQAYYARVAERRGWDTEGPAECMLLLTEEVGELARAIRGALGLARHARGASESAADELADVQLYLVHLANIVGVDLAAAVNEKERSNARRALVSAAA